MYRKAFEKQSSRERDKLEKYIRAFIAKVPQAIVQSRCGGKKTNTNYTASETDIFEIAVEDNPDIKDKVKEACFNINPLQEFCLCVEILLKTVDGDTIVLETWSLRLIHSDTFWDPKYKVYAEWEIIISNLMMLLKSVIAVTRIVPAFKLSLGQKASSHVILYRIYPDEPQIYQLGSNLQNSKIGDVYTPVGTINVSVSYRSKSEITIDPQDSGKENSFMVKSDYFNLDMSPKKLSSGNRIIKSRALRNSNKSQNIGAFATCDLPDSNYPELAFLQKTFLHPSRSGLNEEGERMISVENMDLNSNMNISPKQNSNCGDTLCAKLSCSDLSDDSDFVLVDMKPTFANFDPDTDLKTFYEECQSAPTLSCFSDQPSLKEQVEEVSSQLEKFEISMLDFDNFVESVCKADADI